MKKLLLFLVVAVMFLLATPILSYAESGQECASNCSDQCDYLGSGPEWAACTESCLKGCMDEDTGIPDVPPPTPVDPSESKLDLNSSGTCVAFGSEKETVVANANIMVASSSDDLDQACYAGGEYVGNCSRSKPYHNVFNGECYATLQDCKKADGDLESVPGSGGCVRCGK